MFVKYSDDTMMSAVEQAWRKEMLRQWVANKKLRENKKQYTSEVSFLVIIQTKANLALDLFVLERICHGHMTQNIICIIFCLVKFL